MCWPAARRDKTRDDDLVDNLAASIYKQGEQANADEITAPRRTTSCGSVAWPRPPPSGPPPNTTRRGPDPARGLGYGRHRAGRIPQRLSRARPAARSDQKDGLRLPGERQLSLAAKNTSASKRNPRREIRRDALLVAAELHEEDGNSARALDVYRRYVDYFPQPVEREPGSAHKIAEILKAQNDDRRPYLDELRQIVSHRGRRPDARPRGRAIWPRNAALVLAEEI
jgi:cellulose synthase operon protein C